MLRFNGGRKESDTTEVKWALERITMNKASGGDGIPVEIFQILKDDAVKVMYSICQQIWKTQQWPPGKAVLFQLLGWADIHQVVANVLGLVRGRKWSSDLWDRETGCSLGQGLPNC